ncbi:hypothetical protein DFP72DRAFT_1016088 [Ephemerocybe angulata]|uniref:Uncharacterized protein n=1 Tax=Ephemerocybe angulata TaxID=980116 RepID=A0A8H6HL23_9AGAR|nr:hypothetical protein DFP72DRAFT_1016088 [Tulosesus angulatus]
MSDTPSPEELAKLMADQQKYDQDSQVYYPIAIWIEAVVYGLYTYMFVKTCMIMLKKRAVENFASKVFLVSTTSMFILTTIHCATSLYRLVRGYAQLVVPPQPYMYFIQYTQWDNFSHLVILALITWIGDGLVIYRCFLIWRRNYWVIVLPIIFLLISMATTFVNWRWFQAPQDFKMSEILPVMNLIFPLNLAQNVLTTGLISYKIYMQHRQTRASGLPQLSSAVNLMTIFRIIVESAMLYTVLTIIIIILFLIHHPAVVLPQYAQGPITGIVFSMIALRTHVARMDSTSRGHYPSNSFYPTWVSADGAETGRQRLNMPITVTTVTEQHGMDVIMTPISKTDHEYPPSPTIRRPDRSFPPDMKV